MILPSSHPRKGFIEVKHYLLVFGMAIILIGCTSPQTSNKSIREHLCDTKQEDKPKVKQSGEAELGINSKGEIIRSVSINFESSTLFGRSENDPLNTTPGSC